MSRYNDNAPIGHTCPKIDSVISIIHALYMSSEEMTKQEYADFEKLMEEIRSANSTLREWGNEENKKAEVFLKIEEVSKAIGRNGQNIKLASQLTGYELDVIREGIVQEEDDVELREFSDEIEEWIIEEFEKIGLDTARSIVDKDVADLVRRTDLEEETILEVINILQQELDS